MTALIDPALLDRPDVKAAFPPTARDDILRPLIDYVNMVYTDATTRIADDKKEKQALGKKITALQAGFDALTKRMADLESAQKDKTPPLL